MFLNLVKLLFSMEHKPVLLKLQMYYICPVVFAWIKSFHSDRLFVVKVSEILLTGNTTGISFRSFSVLFAY